MDIQGVPEQNPMLNLVVIERIFQLAEFETNSFANYRLVCTQWYETSLPIWRKNAWLPVTTNRKDHGVYVNDYVKLLKSPENRLVAVPFRKYKIRYWRGVLQPHPYREKKLKRLEFWTTVGPLITHLHLGSCSFISLDNFREVFFDLTPNLQSLMIGLNDYVVCESNNRVYSFDPQRRGDKVNQHLTELIVDGWKLFPIALSEVLWHFPNIEIFESLVEDPRIMAMWIVRGLLKDIESLRNNVGSHYLKNLAELRLANLDKKPNNSLTLQLAPILKCLQFPLKVLTLDVGSEKEVGGTKPMLQIVLESHASTLQELTLAREVECVPFPDFPFGIQLPKLNKFRSTGKLVQDLQFLNYMPNLKFLSLEQEICCSKVGSNNYVVYPNMREFKVTEKFCTDEELNFLGEIMPNLTNITLGLSNKECLKSVCRIWKQVRILNINTRDIDEDAYWKSEEAKEYITTNIRNLRELRSLNLGKMEHFI